MGSKGPHVVVTPVTDRLPRLEQALFTIRRRRVGWLSALTKETKGTRKREREREKPFSPFFMVSLSGAMRLSRSQKEREREQLLAVALPVNVRSGAVCLCAEVWERERERESQCLSLSLTLEGLLDVVARGVRVRCAYLIRVCSFGARFSASPEDSREREREAPGSSPSCHWTSGQSRIAMILRARVLAQGLLVDRGWSSLRPKFSSFLL